MIRPTKYLDLDTCVLNVAAQIVSSLRRNGVMKYDELLTRLQNIISDAVRFEFVLALDLLFLLGKINYDSDSDSIALAGQEGEGPS